MGLGENMKIGFIGCGNMASAMINGLATKGGYDIYGLDHHEENIDRLKREASLKPMADEKSLVRGCDVIVLSIKPKGYEALIDRIKEDVDGQIIMSIAPGFDLERLTSCFGKEVKLARVMPNTPALVGEGMSAFAGKNLTEEEEEHELEILKSFGQVVTLEEEYFGAFIGACGSSPAYVFMMIEALADAAVAEGIKRKEAYKMIAQTVLGSAKMVLETEEHPGVLKDQVASPSGTTIEAICTLEEEGFRNALIKASRACTKKALK
nr:proC: pyrroline-5-carboxylate reductase [uncultured bacterium]